MKHYLVDEFIQDTQNHTKADLIDKKVSLLYDFCLLRTFQCKPDRREKAVREFLAKYSTEAQMTRVLHCVLVGDKTLNELLGG